MDALHGLKVLDLATMMAGPYGATLLGDLGADVIKLEPPTGDEARRIGPGRDGDSGFFVGLNRNKRSVVADLRSDHGQEVLTALIEWADVIVDNALPRTKRALGLDWESIHARNSQAVAVSVSTFGAHGPYADRPGIDPTAQAFAGFMAVTGQADGEPLKAGPPVADAACSLLVVVGALSALRARETTGRGQHVTVSLVDGLIHIQAALTGQFFLLGSQRPRMGNSTDWYAPYNIYRCADGTALHLACFNDKFFARLCVAIDRPELARSPDFAGAEARLRNRDRLDAELAAHFATRAREQAIDELAAQGVIVAPVNDYADLFADPQVEQNAMVVEVAHHSGPLKVTGVPLQFSDTPGSVRLPPPALGEHTAEVLAALGIER
jgi:crotonobetainyl-CoA:carnitine CoA-transferase CaiB-like acyl-CoA transferase